MLINTFVYVGGMKSENKMSTNLVLIRLDVEIYNIYTRFYEFTK